MDRSLQKIQHIITQIQLTRDDFAEFVRVVFVPVEEVGEAHYHQAHDGDEDAEPLTVCQPSPQERHREQTSKDDDSSTQHLEAGGAGHVESWKHPKKRFNRTGMS